MNHNNLQSGGKRVREGEEKEKKKKGPAEDEKGREARSVV